MEVEPAAAASPLALAAAAAPFLPSAASAPAAADDDDEVDPLDAFMESNSVQLVKDDAQLQQQQEAEVDPLDAFMATQVLPQAAASSGPAAGALLVRGESMASMRTGAAGPASSRGTAAASAPAVRGKAQQRGGAKSRSQAGRRRYSSDESSSDEDDEESSEEDDAVRLFAARTPYPHAYLLPCPWCLAGMGPVGECRQDEQGR